MLAVEEKDYKHKAILNFVSAENVASREGLRAGFLTSQHHRLVSMLGIVRKGPDLRTGEDLWPSTLHSLAFIDQPKSMDASVTRQNYRRNGSRDPCGL